MTRTLSSFFAWVSLALVALIALPAQAAPEAHILRVDPRASQAEGAPILTTVLEVVQNKRLSQAIGPCGALTGTGYFDCVGDALQKPQALWSPIPFYEKNATFTIKVDGKDEPTKYISKSRWGSSQNEKGVGTAWLILIDAAASMSGTFDEAKQVAQAFVNQAGPNDIINVQFFNDRAVVSDSRWLDDKNKALAHIQSVPGTYPSQGRTRALFTIIQNAATDGFKDLGNAGQNLDIPLHQAMVVLSNGAAGADPSTTGAGAKILSQYMTKGRFPEDNEALPKTPVPVISIWFPVRQVDELANSQREFMMNMANTEIGGFFSIVQGGQGDRATAIVNAVRERFDKMYIVRWRVSCVAPSVQQTFNLFFQNTNPMIAPDGSYKNVPVGIDPTTWPLDVDVEATEEWAEKNPIFPGGKLKVFGNFCWRGNAQRAELYMVPKKQSAPESLEGGSIEDAKNAQKTLVEAGLKGKAISTSDTFAEFEVPNTTKFLVGKGEKMAARIVLYDNEAKRASAVTADDIITLKATERPFLGLEYPLNLVAIGGITFGGVVIILLLITVFRGGGRSRKVAAAPPPRPIVASGPAPVVASPPMGAAPMPAAPAPPGGYSQATLSGGQGIFTVLPGMEMKAGRDGSVCQILLSEPRVSGTHATLKLEGGQLLVRDENSNNGTHINGQRIGPSAWTPVPPGAALRFGPVEFTVRLE